MRKGMLDIEQVMEWLGVSASTIRRAVKARKLRAYRIGKRLKFKREDVDAYIESQVVPSFHVSRLIQQALADADDDQTRL